MKPEAVDVADLSGGPALQFSMELGFGADRLRTEQALFSLWACRRVVGPWFDSLSFGAEEHVKVPPLGDFEDKTQFGILNVDGHDAHFPFALLPIYERGMVTFEDGLCVPYVQNPVPENSAWITLNLTVAQLAKWYNVDNTWTLRSQPWLKLICDAFAEIADAVHARVPLMSAAIGEEVSGAFRRPTRNRLAHACQDYPPLAVVSKDIIEKRGGVFLDEVLWDQLNPEVDAIILSSGLRYVVPQLDAPLSGA